jgi:DNA-binding CsgD family transcriptional regulator
MLKVLEDLAGADADLAEALPIGSQVVQLDRPVDGSTLWQGLIDGDWIITARHDRDGQRHLTLRRATPEERSRLSLTTREREVLACARHGYSLKLIGHELRLAPSTVSTHLSKGLRKLGLDSVALLAALCCGS